MTCTLAGYDENFVITHTAENTPDWRTGYYYDQFSFKQTSSTGATADIDVVFTCAGVTKTLHLHPYN